MRGLTGVASSLTTRTTKPTTADEVDASPASPPKLLNNEVHVTGDVRRDQDQEEDVQTTGNKKEKEGMVRSPAEPVEPALFYSTKLSVAADPHPFITAWQEKTARRWQDKITSRARRSLGGAASALSALGVPYREFYRQEQAFEWGDNWEATRRAAEAEKSIITNAKSGGDVSHDPDAQHTAAEEVERQLQHKRQRQKLEGAHVQEMMRFFSFEEHGTGRRKFVASTYAEFWRRYRAAAWDERHAYELIREGRPCHLYFDLEYATGTNPSVDGVAATDTLVQYALEDLAHHEGIGGGHEQVHTDGDGDEEGDEEGDTRCDSEAPRLARPRPPRRIQPLSARDTVVELQSTSANKFSRHLIFRLPGVAFANAAHVGHFVRRLWRRVEDNRHTDPRCGALFVNKEGSKKPPPNPPDIDSAGGTVGKSMRSPPLGFTPNMSAEEEGGTHDNIKMHTHARTHGDGDAIREDVSNATPFVDLGVYTRNRAFRLYLSSKNGKKVRLLPTHRLWRGNDSDSSRVRVPATAADENLFYASLVCNVEPGTRLIRYEGVGQQGTYTGRVLQGYGCRGGGGGGGGTRDISGRSGAGGGGGVRAAGDTRSADGISTGAIPCPDTAAFVCKDFDTWSGPGCGGASVRTWVAFPDHGVVVLNMMGNRFCEAIERAHKSNNVMFVVDFREGAYYQRCHDPDCRGVRGCLRPLPSELARESLVLMSLSGAKNEILDQQDRHCRPRQQHQQHHQHQHSNEINTTMHVDSEQTPSSCWVRPKIDSDDDDDEEFWSAAAAAAAAMTTTTEPSASVPPQPQTQWQPPTIKDDDDEAFWNQAAELVDRVEEDQKNVAP